MFKQIFTYQFVPIIKQLLVLYAIMILALIGFHFTPYVTGVILMLPLIYTPVFIGIYFAVYQPSINQLNLQFNIKRRTIFLNIVLLLMVVVILMTVVNFIIANLAMEPLLRWEGAGGHSQPQRLFFPLFYFESPLQMLVSLLSFNLAVGSIGLMIPYLRGLGRYARFVGFLPLIFVLSPDVVSNSIFGIVDDVFLSPVKLSLTMLLLTAIFLTISFLRAKKSPSS